MIALAFQGDAALRTAVIEPSTWLDQLQLWRPADHPRLVTGTVETAAVILGGTFDLTAGKSGGDVNSWPARGARTSPFEGRPMALYLPPDSRLEAIGASGEILLVAARQPAAEAAPAGREALSQSPLLPLAGSGKAFDPATGEWMPAETFPSSPESLPPRRMQRQTVGETVVERVFTTDYKAATLTIDEAVIAPGRRLAVTEIGDRPQHDELLLFRRDANGDAAWVTPTPNGSTDLVIEATDGPVYVLLAYAGK